MNSWLLRGLGLALVHVVIRVVLGFAIAQWPLHGSIARFALFAVVVVVAGVWGYADAKADRRDFPSGRGGADLTIGWLCASALGAVAAGIVCWVIGHFPKIDTGGEGLIFELTSGAAWTLLLIFIPAMIGIGISHFLARRHENHESERTPASV
jgi:hypothetical protein